MTYSPHEETDAETGITLKIVNDPHGHEDPRADDKAVFLAVLHRSYRNPSQDAVLTVGGEEFTLCTVAEIEAFEAANAAAGSPWFVLPLWLLDHSGTAYRVGKANPFSCPWDSGRVGIIALKVEEFSTGLDLDRVAGEIAEEYSDWANGNIWGYVVTDAGGQVLDSVGGFVGAHDAEFGALEQGREALKQWRGEALAALAQTAEAERPDLYAEA